MAVEPTAPTLRVPLRARSLTDAGHANPAWAGYFQDVADRIASAKTGVTDGTDAAPGQIGEMMTATSGGAVMLASGVAANVATVTLTAGDWDVSGNVLFSTDAGTHNFFATGIDAIDAVLQATFPAAAINPQLNTGTTRRSVIADTAVHVVALAGFTGVVTAQGTIRARRMR